ncbi:MAG TPA: hypothetical protein VFD06_04910 [Candidatus Polarisedimenticolia bacterium]|nr:hypothetical protein [Candidatus Polarisedimenticolia bacterium]
MKTRKALLVALVAVAAIGLAHVVMADPSRTNAEGSVTLAGLPDDSAPACGPAASFETTVDPTLPGSNSSQQPQPMASCQIYASDCVFDGGPCGPQGLCHCQENPGFWICAR